MLLLWSLMFATILSVNGQCSLQEQPMLNETCSAEIYCLGTTEGLMDIVKDWGCIKTGNHYYNNYGNLEELLIPYYNLYIKVRNVDIYISEDPLIGMMDVSTNVINLNIENGDLVSVPILVGSLVKLTEFSLTHNKVESINLRKVSAGESIKYLNVSHNCISTIEEDLVEITMPSWITLIDLSHNELELLPDNCFARFTQLKHLNISFNLLKQLDILTFDGITQVETLQLSNNEISEIGQTFARFRKLKDLTLDNNKLIALTDLNFKNLISLENLNLSSNMIHQIEDKSLALSTSLKQLDLSHNKINVIGQTILENSIYMQKLLLSYNDIEHIEGGAFRKTKISYFEVQNNYISGSIEYDTFLGIAVENLDLSNEKLTELGDRAFSSLSSNLRYLNMSNNLIENITDTAFQSLQKLSKLDLSFNNLIDIDFITSDLIQLSEYYLQSNKIKKITPNMFRNMTSLLKLDLSQNKIVDIDLNSFVELINLMELNVSSNHFVNSITEYMFRGLYRLKSLDLSNTRLISCLNQSFSGMISLHYLNVSHSQLETIEFDTFKATGAIKIIDLSYNVLEFFYINTSSISQVSELYLNNNKLSNVTSKTFKNLHLLEKLSLASNNIFYIDSDGFQKLSHLRYLNLFSNLNLHIKSDIFNDLVLSEVSLRKVQHQFNFKNAMNTSIITLILSHFEIDDINSIFVYNVKNVLKLDISYNKIKALDKISFQNMTSVNWLDISFNVISTIQPGTFLSNNMVNTLNLCGNNLQSLQFGVLDGLINLRILNLSNNAIHTFGVNMLHATPHLTELFLENNNLANLDFEQLSRSSIEFLTIGGNSISCNELGDWTKLSSNSSLNVTGESLDFNSENIYGIRCKTSFLNGNTVNKNSNINLTNEVIEIKETVGQLYSYLKLSHNETFSKVIDLLEKVLESSNKVSPNLNYSQLNDHLKDLLYESKNILPKLDSTSNNVTNEIKLIASLLEINNNLTKLNNFPKELLLTSVHNKPFQREENKNSTNIKQKLYDAGPLNNKLDKSTLADIKVLLYFVAVCLAIVILFRVVALTYKYLYRQSSYRIRANNLYDSGQSVRNELELE